MLNSSMTIPSSPRNMEMLLEAFFNVQSNEHVKAWRWHCFMMNSNPNYLDDIAKRQAAKRAAGIGLKDIGKYTMINIERKEKVE